MYRSCSGGNQHLSETLHVGISFNLFLICYSYQWSSSNLNYSVKLYADDDVISSSKPQTSCCKHKPSVPSDSLRFVSGNSFWSIDILLAFFCYFSIFYLYVLFLFSILLWTLFPGSHYNWQKEKKNIIHSPPVFHHLPFSCNLSLFSLRLVLPPSFLIFCRLLALTKKTPPLYFFSKSLENDKTSASVSSMRH